jgi:N utilization substance protein A
VTAAPVGPPDTFALVAVQQANVFHPVPPTTVVTARGRGSNHAAVAAASSRLDTVYDMAQAPSTTPSPADAVRALASTRGIDEAELWQAVADAMRVAYGKMPGAASDVDLVIDVETFSVQVISYDSSPDGEDVTPDGFGRIGAAVFRSALDEAVRASLRNKALARFVGREGEIVHGVVTHVTERRAVVSVEGIEGVLYRSQMLPGERLNRGDNITAILSSLRESSEDAFTLSRTDDRLLAALVAGHPDVLDGSTEVVALAREAGRRAKVVVGESRWRDPVAAFIGAGGDKIRRIQEAMHPERVDVVAYDSDPTRYALALLGVTEQKGILVEGDGDRLTVKTANRETARRLLGPAAANVRLAEKLSGLRVNVEIDATTTEE